MQSIKNKIIAAFLTVITSMILLAVAVIVVNFNLVNKYARINDNIVYEQAFKDDIWLIVQDWYNGIKNNNYTDYQKRLHDINDIQKTLDSKLSAADVSQETKLTYRSVNNSLAVIIKDIEAAKAKWESSRDMIGVTEVFNETNLKLDFVKQNISNLLLIETENIAALTKTIQQERMMIITIFGIVIVIIALFSVILSIFLARRITSPIIALSEIAKRISKGDLSSGVGKNLVNKKDEIGSLSRSFDLMVNNLQEKIAALETSSIDLAKKMGEISASNKELEETKTAMVILLDVVQILGENLKEERDKIQTIIESMGEGLIVVDKDNKISLVNPTAARFLKKTVEELIGKDIASTVPLYSGRELAAWDIHPIAKAVKKNKTIVSSLEDNFFLEKSSGKRFAVLIVATPLSKKDLIGTVMMFRDASEEKALDEAKVGFISVASHQLRTPLTSMRWFSEMLIDGDAGNINEEQKHFIERIYQGTERMINLVNLLLQIARVEAGRLKIEPVDIDFKNTTAGVAFTLKSDMEAKSQKIVIKMDPDPFPTVPMDQEVIWQVIQNLLSNASRYSPAKSIINVSVIKKGKEVEYSVKDQGIGIPKEYQGRIFEKFYRAENALKLVPEGSGLGLSLVKMLVERWGGKIWFETEEGKGTTFYFTIPLSGMERKEGEVGLGV
jgi:PAS domain S-box-containing protein